VKIENISLINKKTWYTNRMKTVLTILIANPASAISAMADLRGQGQHGIDPTWSHTLAQPAL
jgi:hypothetical protein